MDSSRKTRHFSFDGKTSSPETLDLTFLHRYVTSFDYSADNASSLEKFNYLNRSSCMAFGCLTDFVYISATRCCLIKLSLISGVICNSFPEPTLLGSPCDI